MYENEINVLKTIIDKGKCTRSTIIEQANIPESALSEILMKFRKEKFLSILNKKIDKKKYELYKLTARGRKYYNTLVVTLLLKTRKLVRKKRKIYDYFCSGYYLELYKSAFSNYFNSNSKNLNFENLNWKLRFK